MDLLIMFLNTVWLAALAAFVGWCFYPAGFVRKSWVINFPLWMALGLSALFITAALLIRADIPGKHLRWLVPAAAFLRFSSWALFTRKRESPFWNPLPSSTWESRSPGHSALLFGLIFIAGFVIYFMPLIVNGRSGFFSVSGGDISIYQREAEFFLTHGFKSPTLPPNVDLLPPYPNWNILTYINSMRTNGSGLFDGPIATLPLLAFSLSNTIDAHMTAIFLGFFLIALLSAALASWLVSRRNASLALITGLTLSSNLLLWFSYSHATPALISASFALAGTLLFWLGFDHDRIPVLGIAFPLAASAIIYTPFFVVLALPLIGMYLLYTIGLRLRRQQGRPQRSDWLPWLLKGGQVVLTIAVFSLLCFTERAGIKGLLTTVGFSGANFGLDWKHLLVALPGIFDFDLLFPSSSHLRSRWFIGGALLASAISLFFLIGSLRRSTWPRFLVIFIPLALLTGYAYKNICGAQSQYAAIRFAEAASLFYFSLVGMGAACWLASPSRVIRKVATLLLIALAIGLWVPKAHLWARILSLLPHDHSFLYTSADARFAKDLAALQKRETRPDNPRTVYWCGDGAVSFAGTEVLLRELRYFEVFNYDYRNYIKTHAWWSNIEMDISSPERLKGAIFAFPAAWRKEIIHDRAHFMSEPTWRHGSIRSWDTTRSRGMSFVGDAWNAPTRWRQEQWARYLKGRAGYLVFWTDHASRYRLSLRIVPLAPSMGVVFYPDHSAGNNIEHLHLPNNREEYRFSFPIALQPGINRFILQPVGGVTQALAWGLIQRKETDWMAFLALELDPMP